MAALLQLLANVAETAIEPFLLAHWVTCRVGSNKFEQEAYEGGVFIFCARATTTRTSLADGRMVSKVSSEFVAPELDGFGLKSGDAAKVSDGGGVWIVGKDATYQRR